MRKTFDHFFLFDCQSALGEALAGFEWPALLGFHHFAINIVACSTRSSTGTSDRAQRKPVIARGERVTRESPNSLLFGHGFQAKTVKRRARKDEEEYYRRGT